jgi:hypothetical protein
MKNGQPRQYSYLRPGFVSVEISENTQLTDFALPNDFWWGYHVRIANNPKLTTVDLRQVERLDYLDIRSNPALKEVHMPMLEGVDELLVMDNPSLATSAFSNLKRRFRPR